MCGGGGGGGGPLDLNFSDFNLASFYRNSTTGKGSLQNRVFAYGLPQLS